MRLQDMQIGQKATITGYQQGAPTYRARLLAFGLTRGIEVEIVNQAPLGDPVEIRLRGFNLSLRKSEADCLVLT